MKVKIDHVPRPGDVASYDRKEAFCVTAYSNLIEHAIQIPAGRVIAAVQYLPALDQLLIVTWDSDVASHKSAVTA